METRRIAMTIPLIDRLYTRALCALALPVAPILPVYHDTTPQGARLVWLSSPRQRLPTAQDRRELERWL